jgi:hypothetical protein
VLPAHALDLGSRREERVQPRRRAKTCCCSTSPDTSCRAGR